MRLSLIILGISYQELPPVVAIRARKKGKSLNDAMGGGRAFKKKNKLESIRQ